MQRQLPVLLAPSFCCSPAPAWSMRFAKRCVVWSKGDVKVNFVLRKLADVLLLLVVGVIIIASVAVSSVTTSFANVVLDAAGLADSGIARVLFSALTLALALLLDTVVILVLFLRLSGASPPWRGSIGAFLGAMGVELVQLLATSLLGAMRNPVYATIALVHRIAALDRHRCAAADSRGGVDRNAGRCSSRWAGAGRAPGGAASQSRDRGREEASPWSRRREHRGPRDGTPAS